MIAATDHTVISLVGDSITENAFGQRGGASGTERSWPGLMAAWLEQRTGRKVSVVHHRPPPSGATCVWEGQLVLDGRVEIPGQGLVLVNRGRGGGASHHLAERLGETFLEDLRWTQTPDGWKDIHPDGALPVLRWGLAHDRPSLVLVACGINDANRMHPDRTAAQYLADMQRIVAQVHALGATALVVGPHRWTVGRHRDPDPLPSFQAALRTWTTDQGIPFADVDHAYGDHPGHGIHPPDEGHALIWKAILPQVELLLPITPASDGSRHPQSGDRR
jgi:lysophospholipase L1-like esterase